MSPSSFDRLVGVVNAPPGDFQADQSGSSPGARVITARAYEAQKGGTYQEVRTTEDASSPPMKFGP
jgi:hypothetical protein